MVRYAVGNDEAAWDQRFLEGEWDAIQGEALTHRFAECIFEHLPLEVLVSCETPDARILDWGCARGQLVALCRLKFPNAMVDGIDHSRAGIEQALTLYPDSIHGSMLWHPNGFIDRDYDVIFNSNVMEHLVDPLGTLRQHLTWTRKFYVILTPYEEPLGDARREQMTPEQRHAEGHTHVQKFRLGDFPAQFNGFVRTAQIHTVEPGPLWPGYQLLVVYKRI